MTEPKLKIGNLDLIPMSGFTEGPRDPIERAEKLRWVEAFEVVRTQGGQDRRVGMLRLNADARRHTMDFSWHPLDRGLTYERRSHHDQPTLLEAIENIVGCPACLPVGATSKQVDAIKRYNQRLRSTHLSERDPEDTLDVGDEIEVIDSRDYYGARGRVLRRSDDDNMVLISIPQHPDGVWMARDSMGQRRTRRQREGR
jgi:hypothetical protein